MTHVQRHKKKYTAGGIAAIVAVILQTLLANPDVRCLVGLDDCSDTVLTLDGGAP